jgi:Peptidase family C25
LEKKHLNIFILLVLLFAFQKVDAQNSVLTKGNWIKIAVKNTGIYRLDAAFLQKNGFDLASINPQNIKLYGNGAGMLAQPNHIVRPNDLIENSIYIEGESDGKFDSQDYLLFYGQSPHTIFFDSTSQVFKHQFNLYSDTTFYFLTLADTKGLRIKNQASVNAYQDIHAFDEYVFHEVDQKNILAQAPFAGSGREWLGEEFSGSKAQDFIFDISGIIANSFVKITCSATASAYGKTAFVLNANDQNVGILPLDAIGTDRYDNKGTMATKMFSVNGNTFVNASELKMNLSYDLKSLTFGSGYLNFLGVQTKKALKLYHQQSSFRSIESLGFPAVNFVLEKPSVDFNIWDVSNPLEPLNQSYTVQNQYVIFGATTKTLKEFIIFSNTEFLTPVSVQKINNQNLHNAEVPDLVIISSTILKTEAERLAKFRRQQDKLTVLVVSPEEIYNEFSSGKQDISAIRDFMKYLYHKNPLKIKYLLLFGDASYDYKKRLTVVGDDVKSIYIPTYESRESLHPIFSYSSDDYFGFLEDNEGEWLENQSGNHTLEIGIGRLPVKSVEEAHQIVDKLINYGTNQNTLGQWRNTVTFIADDGDGNIHQQDADAFATIVNVNFSGYQTDKIYLDAFPLISLPEGQRSPLANEALNQAFQKGSLIINYNGHGAESGWTDEQILTLKDIESWTNFNNLPLMLTATCQFGRFDDPNQVSGAELSILNAKGGAIALLTTTRPVYQNTNFFINQAFYESVFKPIDGKMPCLGEVMIHTKNNSLQGVLNRNFSLLGDPSMKLAYPEYEAVITKVNEKEKFDTLKAQSKVKVEGEIRLFQNETKVNTFNGKALITVYDKENQLSTRGNKGVKFSYEAYNNILFRGEVTVKNGSFSCSFVVPKDINYQYGKGKILIYAETNDGLKDALGTLIPIIGGAESLMEMDNTPPNIQLYMDDEQFVEGGTTNNNPTFVANVNDESGINLATNGLGHELILTLDDTLKVTVNQYFMGKNDDCKSGQIKYHFKNLVEGPHRVKLKVWDTSNNATESSLGFNVNSKKEQLLENVYCFPNPFNKQTTFSFEHDQEGDDFTVTIDIFDILGHLVKHIEDDFYEVSSPFNKISWNISEDSIPNVTGNYFYRIFVKSLKTTYQSRGSGKIFSIK